MTVEGKKIKWLIYTVLVGLIPIMSRLLIWGVTKDGTISAFSATDFIAFGLVLHISNINEIEHFQGERSWKTAQNGISIAFIAMYSVLFAMSMLQQGVPGLIEEGVIVSCAVSLAVISLLISFSVFDRISKLSPAEV
ncbi:hypothetical protein JWV26_22500 [Ectopseudomonas toyotomiensis]|uniref:Uncharacterized protein n=1 Tax=Ectopseudomonas toyotomiensis TaxID=554344 RepID=A0ABD7DZJ0_9GAMM|nr:hypothetical protein [Pseudomonas toyotomiensis]QSL92480.1 hypothetical protein JWV26_22500 [Pseudomonas toyotomiensis]